MEGKMRGSGSSPALACDVVNCHSPTGLEQLEQNGHQFINQLHRDGLRERERERGEATQSHTHSHSLPHMSRAPLAEGV